MVVMDDLGLAPVELPEMTDAAVVALLARRPGAEWLRKPPTGARSVFIGPVVGRRGDKVLVDWVAVVEKRT